MRHYVVLVPGFFGFGNLGDIRYFHGVREALEAELARQGVEAEVTEVQTLPTASIRHRAARVLETIAAASARDDGPIHVIGHSTGGLDARLAVAPTASLPTPVEMDCYGRLASVVSVATPHYGTPLAGFFASIMGRPLLAALGTGAGWALERGPFELMVRAVGVLARSNDRLGLRGNVVNQLYAHLLSDLNPQRREELRAFIAHITQDQALVYQLTAAGCDLLNACTADPTGVRYGCVVTCGRRPSLGGVRGHRLDPYAQGLHVVYALLHAIAALSREAWMPEPDAATLETLRRALGETPTHASSDGIVPTLSQVWGEIIHVARADHLDVVGHFGGGRDDPHAADWLPSASGFDDAAFRALWRDVARFVGRAARQCELERRPASLSA